MTIVTRPFVASISVPKSSCMSAVSGTKSADPGSRTRTSPETSSTSAFDWNTGGPTGGGVCVVVWPWFGSLPPDDGDCGGGLFDGGAVATTTICGDAAEESIENGASTFPDPLAW